MQKHPATFFCFYMFKQFGTEIVVVSEVGNKKLDSEDVFEEIVSLLHCYSMKLYTKRGKKINADVNGARNIIIKTIPKAFSKENVDEIEGVGLHPQKGDLSQRTFCDTRVVA